MSVNSVDTGAPASGSTGGSSSSRGGQTINASTSFSSMAQLRTEEPALYKAMTQGIGITICQESQRAQDRNHQLMLEAQNPET